MKQHQERPEEQLVKPEVERPEAEQHQERPEEQPVKPEVEQPAVRPVKGTEQLVKQNKS